MKLVTTSARHLSSVNHCRIVKGHFSLFLEPQIKKFIGNIFSPTILFGKLRFFFSLTKKKENM